MNIEHTVKKNMWMLMGLLFSFVPVTVALATEGPSSGRGTGITDPLGNKTVPQVLNTFLNALIQIGAVVIVLCFMWAGFKFVTAMGQEKQITEAKSIFFNTVIGAAILLGARVIATVVETTIKSI